MIRAMRETEMYKSETLLPRFGQLYIADLFHADCRLNRPLDLLADQMRGEAGDRKGKRVENRVWEYVKQSDAVVAVGELRNKGLERRRQEPSTTISTVLLD